jgi:hypothetical protein
MTQYDAGFTAFAQEHANTAAANLRLEGDTRELFDFAGLDFIILVCELKTVSNGFKRTDGKLQSPVRRVDSPEAWGIRIDGVLTGTSSMYVLITCENRNLRIAIGIVGETHPIIEAEAQAGPLYRITRPGLPDVEAELTTRDEGFGMLRDALLARYAQAAESVEISVPSDLSSLE